MAAGPPGRPRPREQTRRRGPTGGKDLMNTMFELRRPNRADVSDVWHHFGTVLRSEMDPKSTPEWVFFNHPVFQAPRQRKSLRRTIDFDLFASLFCRTFSRHARSFFAARPPSPILKIIQILLVFIVLFACSASARGTHHQKDKEDYRRRKHR